MNRKEKQEENDEEKKINEQIIVDSRDRWSNIFNQKVIKARIRKSDNESRTKIIKNK